MPFCADATVYNAITVLIKTTIETHVNN